MQYKQTQQAHESKKKEKEYERLKQKLGQVCFSINSVTYSVLYNSEAIKYSYVQVVGCTVMSVL